MSDVFVLPDPGEGLTEADIVAWKVAAGDSVTVNQILVEIETAKSLVELPSPHAGTIAELLVTEGDTVEVGTPIVRFGSADGDTAAEAAPAAAATAGSSAAGSQEAGSTAGTGGAADAGSTDAGGGSGATLVGYGAVESSSKRRPRKPGATGVPAASTASASAPQATPAAPAAAPNDAASSNGAGASSSPAAAPAAAPGAGSGRPLAKPPVRKLAKDQGIDLASVRATGANGEVTRADLQAHVDGTAASAAVVPQSGGAQPAGGTAPAVDPAREEQVPLKGVKKAMANAMVASAFTSPHVTVGVEIDVTRMMELVRRLKAEKSLGEDVRVSPLLIIAKAVTRAALRHPGMNARLDDEVVTYRNYVNLGVAAATDRGLIVPNIKDADRMGLRELGTAIGELVSVARTGRTSPAAQSGGTITITNVGVFGVDWGTPIINPGESAIVAAGQVQKKPWVVDDELVVREVMTLAASADHRVVDGEVISRFLRDVADVLEDPITLLF